MGDPRIEKLANVLVNYSTEVKPGDWVAVMGNVITLPLINEIVRAVYRAGGNVNVLLSSTDLAELAYREGSEEQLQWISPIEKAVMEDTDVLISISGTDNTRFLNNVDARLQKIRQAARADVFKNFVNRVSLGDLRWVGTQYPCNAYAQEADMSLSEFEAFVYGATFADQPDPIACWQAMHENQVRLVDWLAGKKRVVVRGPNVDLSLSIEGRPFINGDGRKNMPCGEIFTSPVENSANGWIRFTYPGLQGGREVDGIELKFEDGRIINASAKKNEAYLLETINMDEGAHYLGEFAIGTNFGIQRFTKSILYDEKIGGTIHVAVGRGFPEANGVNESSVHWDMICDMRHDSEIVVDGEVFYRNGEFLV
ncbi:MAG: aminopeptidase [Candidatus Promineifilaceae bacterium]